MITLGTFDQTRTFRRADSTALAVIDVLGVILGIVALGVIPG
jgi:hypothetical protein